MPRLVAIPWQRLKHVFELDGFTAVRHEGDHWVMTKPGCKRPVIIPEWAAALNVESLSLGQSLRAAMIKARIPHGQKNWGGRVRTCE